MMMKKTFLIKFAAALTLSMALPITAMGSQAGPGFSDTPTSAQAGPGFEGEPAPVQPDNQTPPPVTDSGDNYYNSVLPDPVVRPVEKYSYDQMSQDLQTLSQRYGTHMQLRSIGRTPDNREIYDAVVGNPDAPKHLMIHASIHGREYITSLVVMTQLEQALAYYETGYYNGRPISEMFDQVAVHFIPMVNPDGVSISQWGEGGIGSEELKQIMRDSYQMDLAEGRTGSSYDYYLATWKSNAKGVDLNHNFDVGWAGLNGAMTHTSATDYKGPSPLSEPETIALATLIEQYPFKTIINYHAMGQVLYWDTAGNKERESSLQLANTISGVTGYRLLNSLGVGGTKDWVQVKDNPIPSVTIEVGRVRCPIPVSEFPLIWEQNKATAIKSLEFALNR